MITKAQEYRLQNEAAFAVHPKLSMLERSMLRWAIIDPGDKVLDVNPKNGSLLGYLARHMECDICGISGNMESVKQTRICLQNADVLYAHAEDIPWRDNSFHTVFLRKTKLDDFNWKQSLKEALRVLKPGGQLLVGINEMAVLRRLATNIFGDGVEGDPYSLQGKAEWMKALTEAGYRDVTWQSTGFASSVAIAWKPLEKELEA